MFEAFFTAILEFFKRLFRVPGTLLSTGVIASKFEHVVEVYKSYQMEYPQLKEISLAHWIVESKNGKKHLAKYHNNYANIKWRKELFDPNKLCKPCEHGKDSYASFKTVTNFIDGYWKFLGRKQFEKWEQRKDNPELFIKYLYASGYSEEDKTQEVINALPQAKKLLAN